MVKPMVGVIMGSDSDLIIVKEGTDLLKKFKISFELKVLSAHRCPEELANYIKIAPRKGIKLFIAAAGGAAALPGVIASFTNLPVIGIPIETKSLKGLDSLLSIVQMPGGIPVACMAIGQAGARNAAILAAQILGITNHKISLRLRKYRREMRLKLKKVKIKI
ncbi:5-(carboxyamino)imidazole ribonucleotide mutase [bacterium]|nr:MAG: 5-(carboxyamino)imidazole ribonucleotide mutase [bacterium]